MSILLAYQRLIKTGIVPREHNVTSFFIEPIFYRHWRPDPKMNALVDFLNTIFWGYVLIYGLLAVGVFFTVYLGFIQFRHFGKYFLV